MTAFCSHFYFIYSILSLQKEFGKVSTKSLTRCYACGRLKKGFSLIFALPFSKFKNIVGLHRPS